MDRVNSIYAAFLGLSLKYRSFRIKIEHETLRLFVTNWLVRTLARAARLIMSLLVKKQNSRQNKTFHPSQFPMIGPGEIHGKIHVLTQQIWMGEMLYLLMLYNILVGLEFGLEFSPSSPTY